MAETIITIQQSLTELRKMFPKAHCAIYVKAYTIGEDDHFQSEIVVTKYMAGESKRFHGPTIEASMAQVRAWKQSQE
jgi:hypothetical protein